MSFVRNLLADLVAKRLWPVAAGLVLALIAVPVVLGKSAEEASTPLAAAPVAKPGTEQAVSMASDGPRGGRTPIGRNPFKSPQVSVPDGGKTAPVASGGGAATGGAGVPVGGSWDTDVPAGSVPGLDGVDLVPVGGNGDTKPAVKTTTRDAWSVDLRFGQDGKLDSRTDVPRLSPLPSADDPFFVFLGVLADGKTALFLVSSDAEATGDGTCLPTPQDCERIEMRAGDTEFFDVVTPEGETKQYQLDLVRVSRQRKLSAAAAAAARSRESAEGREVLRAAVDTEQVDVSDIAYSREMGLVVPSGGGEDKAGSLFGGYRVDLQFGPPGQLVKRYNLARLTPLPSVEEPSFVFLGVLADGETALFLNHSGAATSGDAVCSPAPEDCQRVAMKAGQTALFDVATLSGGSTQYQLDVDGISEIEAATPEEAAASRNRESKAGRIVLRRLINEVGSLVADLSFSPKRAQVVEEGRPEQPQAEPAEAPTPGKLEEQQTAAE